MATFDAFAAGSPIGSTMGQVPRSARWALPAMATAFRGAEASSIEPRVRALALLRAATVDRSPFWRERFAASAAAAGVSDDAIARLQSDEWESTPGLTDRERAAVTWADRVSHRLARRDQQAYRELGAEFTGQEIVELTLVLSLAACFNRFTNAMRVEGVAPPEFDPITGPVTADELAVWTGQMFEATP